jgi:cobalt-zinc-cadmium efflux system outer membrane protein
MQIKRTMLALGRWARNGSSYSIQIVLLAGLLGPTQAYAESPQTLSRKGLITRVLARNPKAEAAKQAWFAMEAHAAQSGARKDPVLAIGLMPTTISHESRVGQKTALSQALEWPGIRALRQEAAMANSSSKQAEFEQVQLELAWLAAQAFENYTALFRSMEINLQNQEALKGLGQSAEAHYISGHGAQSAPLQIQVELALLEKERTALEAQKGSLTAQINGLLHQAPQTPLGMPAPRTAPSQLPAKTLQGWNRASQKHPAVDEYSHQIQRAEQGVLLAQKSRLPDFVVAASTESMPDAERNPLMLSVALNLPFNQARHRAHLTERQAELHRAEARLAETESILGVNQQLAWLALEQAIAHARLYQDQILPAADQQLAATEAGYGTGQEGFIDVLLAQRQRFRLELEHESAIAESWKAQASLNLAFGEMPDADPVPRGVSQ